MNSADSGEAFPAEKLDVRLREHNRSALAYAVLALVGALMAWAAAYGIGVWLMLLGLAASGRYDDSLPAGYRTGFIVLGLLMLIVRRILDQWIRGGQKERRIFGLHTFLQIVLLPAALVWEILENLQAMVRLKREERALALDLLEAVYEMGKLPIDRATALTTDPRRLMKIGDVLVRIGLLGLAMESTGPVYRRPASAGRRPPVRMTLPPSARM